MDLDELIAALVDIRDEHGNCPVFGADGIHYYEFDEDTLLTFEDDGVDSDVCLNLIRRD